MREWLPFRKTLQTALVFLCLTVASGFADSASDFANANREYAAGHYQAATEGYEALVRAGQWNAVLFYNLGNAWFRRGDLGRAILNYERTLALEPHHPEAMANLQLVRDRSRALQLAKGWSHRYLGFGNAATYAWIAATGFWLGIFCLVGFFFSRRRSGRTLVGVVIAFCVGSGAAFALYKLETGSHGRNLAIVITKNVAARLATADNANTVLALPVGSEVQLLSKRGGWAYAALPNNLRGWIPANSVELVRL